MSKANRKRAGRKRIVGVDREPNGRVKRSPSREVKEAARETVTLDRMRRYGLTRAQAQTDLAGYVIGRMALRGEFGSDWRPYIDAVTEYVEAVADFMRIKHPLMPMPKAMDYMASRGQSLRPEPTLKTVQRIERRYERYVGEGGILSAATGIQRMHFHEAAFFDRVSSEEGYNAVRCVVKILRDS